MLLHRLLPPLRLVYGSKAGATRRDAENPPLGAPVMPEGKEGMEQWDTASPSA